MTSKWESLNAPSSTVPTDPSSPFTISTPPKTDIWRRTASNDFNAPAIGRRINLAKFESLTATVSGPWKTQFDQGGILIVILATPESDVTTSQWIKAGIEYFNGEPRLGVVGTDRFSDWSLCPMFERGSKATLEAVKEEGTLWIYALVGEKREPLREIKWAALDREGGGVEVWAGVYAAKPTPDADGEQNELVARFEDVKLGWSD